MLWLIFVGYFLGIGATIEILDKGDLDKSLLIPFIWPFVLLIYLGGLVPFSIKKYYKR